MMKKSFILLIIIFITSCKPPECHEVRPLYLFKVGELPVFKATGEQVRIIGIWSRFGGRCRYLPLGEYTVRFKDGAEIAASWRDLEPKENKEE